MSCVCFRQLASRTRMSLALLAALRTCRTFEAPSNLLDPKVTPFEALLVLLVFRGARTECQAMAAESERGWVPRPQRSHQVPDKKPAYLADVKVLAR